MNETTASARSGLPAALGAYLIWGVLPLYLILVKAVPPVEFVAWRIVWTLPLSANMVLRNFGLTVFLAQVGIASGPQFAATVAVSGLTLLPLGIVIMLALILATMLVGRLLGIAADDLFGIVSGVTGNPAILVYANRAFPTERTDISYAIVFPTITVAKILFVQIAAAVLGG